ncbi:MAG: efflux RND transporter permease subunit [bacterium]|nr:efflux RND transporter permease subunit [bacterium]
MIITDTAIKHRVTVYALIVIILIIGTYSYLTLPREAAPDITIPFIIVSTDYEGVAPSDIEALVTCSIEKKLTGLADVEEIRSVSAEGHSTITIEFTPDVDIDDALRKVKDKVDAAKGDLPSGADDPSVMEINFSEFPIMMVNISGDRHLMELKAIAEKLEDQIETIHGVLDVQIIGGLEREIRVEFDMDRVASYRIPFNEIIASVRQGNVNLPGGSVEIDEAKYTLRIPAEYKNPLEIYNLIVYVRDGRPVYLRDIATVVDGFKEQDSLSRFKGKESITLSIQKRSGENIIFIAQTVKAIIAEAEKRLPKDVKITITQDYSKMIDRIVKELENNILTGLVLILVVIFIFIGGRSALFIASAIPFSMLIAFATFSALGITLNMVVLFSLILALGMLVDNGIVIVENTYRHLQEGSPRIAAAQIGAAEVAWPVITSTLTTVCAFLPLLFWPGIMGEFMGFLPRTVIITLVASLAVALIMNPVFCASFLSAKKKGKEKHLFIHGYERFLTFILRHRVLTVAVFLMLLIASIASFIHWGTGMEFFPEVDPERAYINIEAPQGTTLATSLKLALPCEQDLSKYSDIKYFISNIGSGGGGGGHDFSGGGPGMSSKSQIAVEFVDFEDRRIPSPLLIDKIRKKTENVVGADVLIKEEGFGPPSGAPVNIEISGEDFETLGLLAKEVREKIKNIKGLINLDDDYVQGKPELRMEIDKEKASLLGLSPALVANTVKSAMAGIKVGEYRAGEDEYDIIARLPEQKRKSIESIEALSISDYFGRPVPLTTVARVEFGSGLGVIRRIDQKRAVTVSADVFGRLPNDVLDEVRGRLADLDLPDGYKISFTGQNKEQEEARGFIGKAFCIAIFLISLVLITQFNSITRPFIIMTSVILSLMGVFLGLLITRQPFGIIMTGVGVISLAGVVVNNAIVLIAYIEQLKETGMDTLTALVKAGVTRFRPVMLTAVTTILGLLPMATKVSFDFHQMRFVVGGESSQFWNPMAVAVIFGLSVATFLTLGVVPVLYSLFDRTAKSSQ